MSNRPFLVALLALLPALSLAGGAKAPAAEALDTARKPAEQGIGKMRAASR